MADLAAAQRLLEAGRIAEAERVFRQALDEDPRNSAALGGLGEAALRQGDAERAMELLRRAVLSAPSDATIHQHLGRAHELCADFASAVDAYATAVRLDPALFAARLHLGSSLERLRETDAAVVQYKRALDDAQRGGHWLDRASTPALLRPLIEHAVTAVRRNRRAVFDRLFSPLRARYGPDSLGRVERCVRIFLNEERPEYPDPRQRPSFLFFPGLPTCAYFDRAIFSWIDSLEAATGAIHAELEPLLRSERGERVLADDQQEAASLQGAEEPPSWTGYYFYRHGVRREDNCAACPSTARALDALPLCRIREHGPEVHFSVFTAGTHLLPHRGVTNTRVVGHLPLIVPEDCAISVGGEIHCWQAGRVVVFDDTMEHEAWNRSRTTRVILIFDTWNPYLTEVERAAVTELVGAIGDFRSAVERA